MNNATQFLVLIWHCCSAPAVVSVDGWEHDSKMSHQSTVLLCFCIIHFFYAFKSKSAHDSIINFSLFLYFSQYVLYFWIRFNKLVTSAGVHSASLNVDHIHPGFKTFNAYTVMCNSLRYDGIFNQKIVLGELFILYFPLVSAGNISKHCQSSLDLACLIFLSFILHVIIDRLDDGEARSLCEDLAFVRPSK